MGQEMQIDDPPSLTASGVASSMSYSPGQLWKPATSWASWTMASMASAWFLAVSRRFSVVMDISLPGMQRAGP